MDFIITEDSDLLPYSCPIIVLFKLQEDGWGEEITNDNLNQATKQSMSNFNLNMILTPCILTGREYLENVDKVGFKTAQKYVQ